MKRVCCVFSGRRYDATTRIIVEQCNAQGIEARIYDDRWLMATPYYEQNRWIFEAIGEHNIVEGFGWCNWKAFIIQQELKRLAIGDIVMYLDADTYPVSSMVPLYDMCDREAGILLFEEQGCTNLSYTRADCFVAMGRNPWDIRADERHACGRFQLFQKGPWRTEQFLQEWLTYSVNPNCQMRHGSQYVLGGQLGGDAPQFVRNSCEQSVLSNLAHNYKLPLHRTPCQNGWPHSPNCGVDGDDYDQVFFQLDSAEPRGDTSGSAYFNLERR